METGGAAARPKSCTKREIILAHDIQKVAFADVLRHFEQHHPVREGNMNAHARECMEKANDLVHGEWAYVRLDPEEAREIILPHHISEGGTLPLIPPTGMTVRAAADKIRQITLPVYSVENPACWKKLDYWRGRYGSPLFLSIVTVDHPDYHQVTVPDGGLVHLDGLHRLLAWDLSGRFDSFGAEGEVPAYVAGFPLTT